MSRNFIPVDIIKPPPGSIMTESLRKHFDGCVVRANVVNSLMTKYALVDGQPWSVKLPAIAMTQEQVLAIHQIYTYAYDVWHMLMYATAMDYIDLDQEHAREDGFQLASLKRNMRACIDSGRRIKPLVQEAIEKTDFSLAVLNMGSAAWWDEEHSNRRNSLPSFVEALGLVLTASEIMPLDNRAKAFLLAKAPPSMREDCMRLIRKDNPNMLGLKNIEYSPGLALS